MGSFGFPKVEKENIKKGKGKDSWEETVAQKS